MTLYDLELDGGRPPFFPNTYSSTTPVAYTIRDLMFGTSRVGFTGTRPI